VKPRESRRPRRSGPAPAMLPTNPARTSTGERPAAGVAGWTNTATHREQMPTPRTTGHPGPSGRVGARGRSRARGGSKNKCRKPAIRANLEKSVLLRNRRTISAPTTAGNPIKPKWTPVAARQSYFLLAIRAPRTLSGARCSSCPPSEKRRFLRTRVSTRRARRAHSFPPNRRGVRSRKTCPWPVRGAAAGVLSDPLLPLTMYTYYRLLSVQLEIRSTSVCCFGAAAPPARALRTDGTWPSAVAAISQSINQSIDAALD